MKKLIPRLNRYAFVVVIVGLVAGIGIIYSTKTAFALRVVCSRSVYNNSHTARVSCYGDQISTTRFRVEAQFCDRGYRCWKRYGLWVYVDSKDVSVVTDYSGYTASSQVSWQLGPGS